MIEQNHLFFFNINHREEDPGGIQHMMFDCWEYLPILNVIQDMHVKDISFIYLFHLPNHSRLCLIYYI